MRCCDISSRMTHMLKVSSPPPPYSSGMPRAPRPASFVLAESRTKSLWGICGAAGATGSAPRCFLCGGDREEVWLGNFRSVGVEPLLERDDLLLDEATDLLADGA